MRYLDLVSSIVERERDLGTTLTTKTTKALCPVITAARGRFGDEVAAYIEDHPDIWNRWLDEFRGLADRMRKDDPQAGPLADRLAAEAVASWIAFTLSLLEGETYRDDLQRLWTALKENTKRRVQ